MKKTLPFLLISIFFILIACLFSFLPGRKYYTLPIQQNIQTAIKTVKPSVVSIMGDSGILATGVAIEATRILTTKHSVVSADRYILQLPDGRKVSSQVIARHPLLDLAILEMEEATLDPMSILSSQSILTLGDFVLGFGVSTSGVVPQFGILSAMNQEVQFSGKSLTGLLATDMRLGPGDSGGPLVNFQSELIGISTGYVHSSDVSWATPVDSKILKEWIGDMRL